jgi:hypothetical protein
MPSPQNSLIHEATSVFRLVESIDRYVAEHENLFAYTDATQDFFSDVHTGAAATKRSVAELIRKLSQTPGQAELRHQRELLIHKGHWRTLHTYIKPATDAHTLNLPLPLIRMATDDLRSTPGMSEIAIVVLLTPELMFYHNMPQSRFGRERVFVEVPYSQGPSFFASLIIYHELGHYVFEKLKTDQTSRAFVDLADAQEQAFAQRLGPALPSASLSAWAKGRLDAWTKEIFCDLFALRHLGPAFSFTLIDFLSLIGLMEEETVSTFDQEHPAAALRFREQMTRLIKDGWWAHVSDLPSEHVALMNRLASKNESDYIFEFQNRGIPVFVEAFLSIVPSIHALVAAITPHSPAVAEDFGRRRQEIEECLLHGIVPSKLFADGTTLSPKPVSMINAAYCFYLTRLPELMKKLENQEDWNLEHRKNWVERLEAWTMKGIEDAQLLAQSADGG